MTDSLRGHPAPSAQPSRLIAGVSHRVRRAWHLLPQVPGLGLDEAEEVFAPVRPLPREPSEDGREEARRSDRHMTLLMGGAPAGSCDFAGRRTGRLARGCARGPILSNSFHDLARERSNARPCITVLPAGYVPPATFPRLGFGRARAFNHSQRAQSCQIVRASQHLNVSHSLPMLEVEQKEIPRCGTTIPSSRSIAPSARWST